MIFEFRILPAKYVPAARKHLHSVLNLGSSHFHTQILQQIDFMNSGHYYVVVYDKIDNDSFKGDFEYGATYLGGKNIHEAAMASPIGFYRSTVMGMCMFYERLFTRCPNSHLAAESAYDYWADFRVISAESTIYPDEENTLFVLPSGVATIERIESLLRESKGFMGFIGAWSQHQEVVNRHRIANWIDEFIERATLLHCHIFKREGELLWSKTELVFD